MEESMVRITTVQRILAGYRAKYGDSVLDMIEKDIIQAAEKESKAKIFMGVDVGLGKDKGVTYEYSKKSISYPEPKNQQSNPMCSLTNAVIANPRTTLHELEERRIKELRNLKKSKER